MSSAHTETPTAQPPLSPAASAHLPESTAVVARTHGEAISLFGSKLNASRFCSISGLEYGTVYTEEGQPDRLVERALACHGNKAQGTNGGCRQSGELVKLEVRIGVADAIVAYMLRTLDSCSSAAHAAYGLIPMRAVSLAFQQVIDASNITLAYRGNFWMSLAQVRSASRSTLLLAAHAPQASHPFHSGYPLAHIAASRRPRDAALRERRVIAACSLQAAFRARQQARLCTFVADMRVRAERSPEHQQLRLQAISSLLRYGKF